MVAIETVPRALCFNVRCNSGAKYREALDGVRPREEERKEVKLSPPVPVAVGSPLWQIKFLDTAN
jgi:hypothetical protein